MEPHILLIKYASMKKLILKITNLKRLKTKTTSSRCRVCNTVNTDQITDDGKWKCKTCDNLLDEQGNVIAS